MLSDYMVAVNMCEAICKEPHHKYNNTKFLQDVLLKQYQFSITDDSNEESDSEGSGEEESDEAESGENSGSGNVNGDGNSGGLRSDTNDSAEEKQSTASKVPKLNWNSPSTASTCEYHEHGDDRPCYKIRFGVGLPSKRPRLH
jgi:hypothetical protein